MSDYFYAIDLQIFRFCNATIANPVFDFLMPLVTDVKNFIPIYILLFIWLLWKGGRTGRICAAALAVAVLIADPVNSRILKEFFGRIRPCSALEDVRLLVPCGGGKSFPSTHAVNNFIAAYILSHWYRRQRAIFYSIAALVAFSRVYVGVHYPSDILGGALEGTLLGMVVVYGAGVVEKFFVRKDGKR